LEVKLIKYPTDEDWIIVRNNALITQRKYSNNIPSSKLKTKFLFSEHSPIRSLEFIWEWIDIPYWVSVHFVRHHVGATPFVSSQRNDIQHVYDRNDAPQNSLVNHREMANAQAILKISQPRLCLRASQETRDAWILFLNSIKDFAPELYLLCVRPCVYRNGICPEVFSPCGYNKTDKFQSELSDYLNIINELY
jgi:hypothetical protein